MTAEKLLEHQGAILLAQSDGCAVWQFRNETGDGMMTTYEIFSGVMLAFNDFHMERYECDFVKSDEFEQESGLGLPICKIIVEKLSGRLGVSSEVGEGSCFSVYLPLADA